MNKPIEITGYDWGGAGGIMNVSKLKTGEVTVLRLYFVNGEPHMHLVSGTAKTPEKWQEDGWNGKGPFIPSLEINIDGNLEEFQEHIASQHYIVTYGNISKKMTEYCKFTGIKFNEHKKIEF